jgi:hypothetical protein
MLWLKVKYKSDGKEWFDDITTIHFYWNTPIEDEVNKILERRHGKVTYVEIISEYVI